MHVSPAKHSYMYACYQESVTIGQTDRQTGRQTDGRTDRRPGRQTPDKVITMCISASQATQKLYHNWLFHRHKNKIRWIYQSTVLVAQTKKKHARQKYSHIALWFNFPTSNFWIGNNILSAFLFISIYKCNWKICLLYFAFKDYTFKTCKMEKLHRKYVFAPADKAANNLIIIWKRHYVEVLKGELNTHLLSWRKTNFLCIISILSPK